MDNIGWIGNGICSGEDYFVEECEFDRGDCDNCIIDTGMFALIGNGVRTIPKNVHLMEVTVIN